MCIEIVENFKFEWFKIFVPKAIKLCCPCWALGKKFFFSHFTRYNLTICAINFCKIFCTCSPSSLKQDPMVENAKK